MAPSPEPALVLVPGVDCLGLAGAVKYVFVFLLPLDLHGQMRPSKRSGCRQVAVEAAAKWEDGLLGIRSLSCWQGLFEHFAVPDVVYAVMQGEGKNVDRKERTITL